MQGKGLLLSAISGLAVLSVSASALAWEGGCMSAPDGWYLEANGGSTHISNISFGSGASSSQSGIGGNVNLGYKFMPYFAGELGYSRYANTSVKDQFGNKAASVKFYSYDISGRGILPVYATGFEFFAKLGVQRMNTHISVENSTAANNIGLSSGQHNTTGLYLGAGAQYYFIPELAVALQWQRAQGNSSTGNADLYTLGVSFIFD